MVIIACTSWRIIIYGFAAALVLAGPVSRRIRRMSAARWLREPLVHFFTAGALVFGAFALVRDDPARAGDNATILVDRRQLLTFLQYRANAFEEETFGTALDAMSDAEIAAVIDAYVSEEILYREAKEYGFDSSDNIIRQRMVQKMSFLLTDVAAAAQTVERDALEDYFRANIEAYAIAPWVTFTHVFFDADRRGAEGARRAALEVQDELNARGVEFNDGPAMGDRFPLDRNYVERTLDFVAGHFGQEFAAELEQLEPSAGTWQGPIRSAYGEHLVLLTRSVDRSFPELDQVLEDVERDYLNEQTSAAMAGITRAIRDRYRIEIGEIRSPRVP
jgi:hypothetical protein